MTDAVPPERPTARRAGAMRLPDDVVAINDWFYDQGLADGLPVIPPTPERVEAMLEFCDRDSFEVVGTIPPGFTDATVEELAVNAVLAGCQPEFFPIVLTAVEAMTAEEFNLLGIQATTHPVAPLLIVNGPVAAEVSVNGGAGCLGPGWRANATIGRALRLILWNIGEAHPGSTDKSTFGSPAKFAFVLAENADESPWEPWHVEQGFPADTSTVTVVGCEAPHNINDHGARSGAELLQTICGTIATTGNNDIYLVGNPVLLLSPEHAATIAADGLDKRAIRRHLFEHARVPMSAFTPGNLERFGPIRPEHFADPDPDARVPLVDDPDQFTLLVAGGPGKHSCFLPTFGQTERVIRPITRRDGTPVASITDLR